MLVIEKACNANILHIAYTGKGIKGNGKRKIFVRNANETNKTSLQTGSIVYNNNNSFIS